MKFDKTPKELVTEGKFNNGVYNDFIDNINPLDANIHGDKRATKFARNIALKEWHAYQFGDEKFFCFLVVMDMKKTAMIEVIVYDIERKIFYKHLVTKPIPGLSIGKNLKSSKVFYRDKKMTIEISNSLANNEITLNFEGVFQDGNSIKCSAKGNSSQTKPLISAMPINDHKSIYAHKQPLTMSGVLEINDETHIFDENAFLIIDDQKSYYPRNFWWNWMTAVKVIEGNIYGFNLTENQSTDPKKYNENCMWYNNDTYRLPPVKFSFDSDKMVWKITDENGDVNLTFDVIYKNAINKNFVVIKSNYYAPFGWVNGTLKAEGITLNIDKYFAMGEKINITI